MGKLSTEKRHELKDSDFGIPEKRMYPLHDKAHVESAVKLFGHANPKDRKALARRILARAKEFNMDTSGWEKVLHYAQEQVPPMSDGTSLGNTPPLTIDTFNETSKNVFTSGDFNKYKKTDLSNNRGPIIAQEQTLYGIGAYTGDEEHKIPVECPNNMTDDEKLLYQIIFDNHGDFDIINTIIERIVAPLCDKLGLKDNAITALMKYRHADNEEDLWDNGFEHSDYVWGYLYPAAKGMIKSDHIANITFDADCSYIENPKHKRPSGYKQIVVEVELTKNGVINTHVISPTKTESQKLLSFDIAEYRDLVNMRASRDTFEKMCMDKIDAILPSDLKKFIKNSGDTYYSYPAKYFAALGMFDSIEDISRIYMRDEFNYDRHVKKLNHNDWQKKMEILDDVLKDTAIPIGFSDDLGDLFILYKPSTGEIVESRHGQVLAKSWKEFESKLRKTSPDKFPERDTKFMKICKEKIETILPDNMKKFIQNNNWVFYQYSYPDKHLDAFFMYDDISQIVDNFVRNEFKYNPAVSDDRVSNASGNAVGLIDRVLEDTEILFGFNNDNGAMLYYKTSNGNIIMSHPSKIIAKSWREFESKLKKTDLRDQPVQEAAVGASLLTLKNQLQRMVGNAFKFIGGSLVPKFTMQSNEKPEVSFDVNAVGQNVEVTPKYNGTPDTMHKRKGIAFMSAANTIADFVESIVSKYKPTMATEYVQDELFTRVQMLVGESAANDDFFPKRKL